MFSHTRYLILTFVVFVLLAGGCQSPATPAPESAEAEVTIIDALGRTQSFERPPERIAIAGRANFMLNDAAYLFPEAPERVVALTKASQRNKFVALLDPNVEDKLLFTLDAGPEQIATVQPDLVLLKSFMAGDLGEPLEALGIPIVYLDLESPEQYERDLQTLGKIFAAEPRAEEIQSFYRDQVERVAEGVGDLPESEKPRVLVLQYSEKGGEVAFKVPPAGWIQTEMVEIGGGIPVWKESAQGGGWIVVNLEQIAAWDPDQIYVINYFSDVDELVERLAADPNWQALRAVGAGELHAFPKDFYSWDQPDTRWSLGLTWLAKEMHPNRFPDIDVREEIVAFYETLYDLDRETVEAEIFPILQGLNE